MPAPAAAIWIMKRGRGPSHAQAVPRKTSATTRFGAGLGNETARAPEPASRGKPRDGFICAGRVTQELRHYCGPGAILFFGLTRAAADPTSWSPRLVCRLERLSARMNALSRDDFGQDHLHNQRALRSRATSTPAGPEDDGLRAATTSGFRSKSGLTQC